MSISTMTSKGQTTIPADIRAILHVGAGDTDGFWQAIKFADVALYRAKETGRNKSVRFTADMWNEEQF